MNAICACVEVYYSVEHNNYYCKNCKRGMGLAYYKLAKQLENLYVIVDQPEADFVGLYSTLALATKSANENGKEHYIYKGTVDQELKSLRPTITKYRIIYIGSGGKKILAEVTNYKAYMEGYASSLLYTGFEWKSQYEGVIWSIVDGNVRNIAAIIVKPIEWEYHES